jgi:hypothetical protein
LISLVGMEDLGFKAAGQGHLKDLQAELRIKTVPMLPALGAAFSQGVHVPGGQIDNRHQVQESLPQRDMGNLCRPDLIWSRDGYEINQTGKALCRFPRHRVARYLVDRSATHALHEVTDTVTADWGSIPGQVAHHSEAAYAGSSRERALIRAMKRRADCRTCLCW